VIVVADTSPLNYLVLIGEVDILPKIFGKLTLPSAVLQELSSPLSPDAVRNWLSISPDWIELREPRSIDASIKLGIGEVAAISLAVEIDADLVLIDDRKARREAIDRGLRTAGTINVLETAADRDLLDLTDAFDRLLKTNFRIAPHLITEILRRNRL
jgi:predicted nucleic acid-binding protein